MTSATNERTLEMVEVEMTQEEKAVAAEQRRRTLRNWDWFEEHALEIFVTIVDRPGRVVSPLAGNHTYAARPA